MRRRDFIAAVAGSAAAWPLAAPAQQLPKAIIGFLSLAAPDHFEERLRAFHRGLADTGYVEGKNVRVEYRWAEYRYDLLPELAADLVRLPVDVIVVTSGAAIHAAKAASTSTPIVFYTGGDPVQIGMVESLNRPGSNLTGVYNLANELVPKRLELLHQLVPSAAKFAVLLHPNNPGAAKQAEDTLAAAQTLGLELQLFYAKSEEDFRTAFNAIKKVRAGGVVIAPELFFTSKSRELAALATKDLLPAVFQFRNFVTAGGLMSYGTDFADSYRVMGTYAGRVLKGARPSDLPVQQSTKVELIINLRAAKTLGITVPLPLLGRADEVIE